MSALPELLSVDKKYNIQVWLNACRGYVELEMTLSLFCKSRQDQLDIDIAIFKYEGKNYILNELHYTNPVYINGKNILEYDLDEIIRIEKSGKFTIGTIATTLSPVEYCWTISGTTLFIVKKTIGLPIYSVQVVLILADNNSITEVDISRDLPDVVKIFIELLPTRIPVSVGA
jgi:hypothetical protein